MKQFLLLVASALFFSTDVAARTFYLKSTGNDAASGLSIVDAWKTIAKINSTDFNIGDTVLFEAGTTFDGGIYLSEEDSATASKPLFISSYGTGRATIYAHKGFGLYAYNVATIQIDKLNFSGLDADSSTSSGVFFYTDNPSGKKYKFISLTNLDISGFQTGIQLGSWHNTCPGYSNIRLSKLNVSNNLKDGLSTYDMAENSSTLLAHDSLFVDHCYFGNNGFSGIVLGGVNYGIVERSKASRSGQLHNKGVVGIWVWNSKNVTFQYCIADSTRTDGGDGGGFDIDGGTESCTVQYCYSFFNDGPGFMHCDYPKSRPTKNNTIRYNITEADGQQPFRDKSSLTFISWGTGLSNCLMYNNTSFIGNKAFGTISGLQGNILDDYDVAPNMHNNKAFNNIVYASGDSNYLLRLYNGKTFHIDTNALQFAANNYYSVKGSSRRWNDGTTNYSSLGSWRTATKQEIFGSKNTGFSIDPKLQNPGMGGSISFSQIDSLQYLLQDYTLLKTSPIIDSGMNVKIATGADIGKSDFFLNSPLFGISQDIGAHETQFPNAIKETFTTALKAYPNPFKEQLTIILTEENLPANFVVINSLGQKVLSGNLTENKTAIGTEQLSPGIYFLKINDQNTATFVAVKN